MIYICSANKVHNAIAAHPKAALLSIADSDTKDAFTPYEQHTGPKLRVYFDDVSKPHPFYEACTAEQVKAIKDFLDENKNNTIIIHCFAGISRSTACASYLIPIKDLMQKAIIPSYNKGYRNDCCCIPNKWIMTLMENTTK